MDIQKIVEFLDQYPIWFKLAAVAAFALVVIGLLTLREPKPSVQKSDALPNTPPIFTSTVAPSSSEGPSSLPLSATPRDFADFFIYRKALDGRFFELEEFAKQLTGKVVNWEAFVASVSDKSLKTEFPILIVVTGDQGSSSELGTVSVPESLRTKAYSFRRGDRIRFQGVISSASSNPSVEAMTIELVPPKTGS